MPPIALQMTLEMGMQVDALLSQIQCAGGSNDISRVEQHGKAPLFGNEKTPSN